LFVIAHVLFGLKFLILAVEYAPVQKKFIYFFAINKNWWAVVKYIQHASSKFNETWAMGY
jgi:hypothetical protein